MASSFAVVRPESRHHLDALFADLLAYQIESSPTTATTLGDHARDGDLDDWGPTEADTRLRRLSALRTRLDALPQVALDDQRPLAPMTPAAPADADAAGDRLLLADAIDGLRFPIADLREHARDPQFYLGLATGSVYDLLRRDDLPAAERRTSIRRRAGHVPRLLEQARANLDGIPGPHRELALRRVAGAARLFRSQVVAFAPEAASEGEAAAGACERFGRWLSDSAEGPAPDWRLGEPRFGDALRLALGVQMPADEIARRARARLEELQADAERLAAVVLGRRGNGLRGADLIRAGLDEVARDALPSERLVPQAAAVLDGIRAFLRDWGQIDLPAPDTLRVQAVPDFLQGYAVAFFVPPPALEPAAAATYYLSPVPQSWDQTRAGSFLREYNVHTLRAVGIHEAYPGHYVQFEAALGHPRLLRRVLWNAAFAEGWATYVERLVTADGAEALAEHPGDAERLRLSSVKMAMRTIANALLDHGLHVSGWDDARARELLVDTTYQEESEAEGKLSRGKVTAGQLSCYFVGAEEMADLRRDVAAARGRDFHALTFHRDVLAQGTPPFRVLRQALLGSDATRARHGRTS